jgi:hypothetical protein
MKEASRAWITIPPSTLNFDHLYLCCERSDNPSPSIGEGFFFLNSYNFVEDIRFQKSIQRALDVPTS